MRPAFLCLLLLLLGLALPSVRATKTTPKDGDPEAMKMCLLTGMEFTNGLRIIDDFRPNKFNYLCSCEDLGKPFETVLKPTLMDPGSSVEVTFNGKVLNHRDANSAISNGGDDGIAPNSPRTQSEPMRFVTGQNEIIIGVGCNGRGLPEPCYYTYRVTCELPDDGGFIVGDPQFVGLRGQQYQVHGVSGEIYNIVSDADLQYNSRFVFLEQGECPVVDGTRQKGCFSHPGSYLGEVGIKTRLGERVRIDSGSAARGFESVEVNGKPVEQGQVVLLSGNLGSVSRNSSHLATVSVGQWEFTFENSDRFVNQRVRVRDARQLRSHGLLGQTWRETTYPNSIRHIAGVVDDYVIREKDIFGDSFVYNMFN